MRRTSAIFLLFFYYELKVETCSKFYSTLEFNSQHRNLPVKRYFLHSVDTSTISIKCFFLLVNNKLRLQQLNLLTVVKNYIVKLMRISVKRKVYTCSDVIKYFFFLRDLKLLRRWRKFYDIFAKKKLFLSSSLSLNFNLSEASFKQLTRVVWYEWEKETELKIFVGHRAITAACDSIFWKHSWDQNKQKTRNIINFVLVLFNVAFSLKLLEFVCATKYRWNLPVSITAALQPNPRRRL